MKSKTSELRDSFRFMASKAVEKEQEESGMGARLSVSFRLPCLTVAKLDEFAERLDTNRKELIEVILEDAFVEAMGALIDVHGQDVLLDFDESVRVRVDHMANKFNQESK